MLMRNIQASLIAALLFYSQAAATQAPLRLCTDPDWSPFEIINHNGEHEGIAADLLRLVSQRAGLQLELQHTKDWDDTLQRAQQGECDLVSFLNESPERSAYLLFTDPLFTDSNILIARHEHPFVTDPGSLGAATLALPSGTSIEERIRQQYPQLQIIRTTSEAEALRLVSDQQADFTIRSLTVAAHTIRREGWFNLKIAGQLSGYDNFLRIGVHPAQADIRDRLNTDIATLSAAEVNEIVNRHVGLRVEPTTDYRLLWQWVLIFTLIICLISATSWFWIRRLKRLNEQLQRQSLTDALTGLPNRLALDQHFAALLVKARRYQRPLALVMLDLDHFKKVNDELGHQCGDRVLQETAQLIRTTVRSCDIAGRWGGEEFLILCPETSAEQACYLAERIRTALHQHSFSSQRPQTISAGVAVWQTDDTTDSLLQRADAALYDAKRQGRDCCVMQTTQAGTNASR